jgi:hypothetical protein
MNKVHFVTFGCDNAFKYSRERLVNEAMDSGWFDTVFTYEPNQLLNYNKSFEGRGAGYWWWKPVVQSLVMNQIDDGDFLLYLDAGFYINKYAKNIFDEYIDIVNKNAGFLALNCFSSTEKHWTKRDLFKLLNCDSAYYTDSPQIASGLVIYKKNELSIKFLQEYESVCSINHAVNDHPSYNKNYEGFIEHRHDQSVFGLLVKKIYKNEDISLIDYYQQYPDETDFVKKWMMDDSIEGIQNLKHPFLAARLYDTNLKIKI